MSRDWKPLAFYVFAADFICSGKKAEFSMKNPQYYFTSANDKGERGETLPVRCQEYCDKFPYTAFFLSYDWDWRQGLSIWDKYKNNEKFLKTLETLESQLRLIGDNVLNIIKKGTESGERFTLNDEDIFKGVNFPDLIDFVKAQKEYSFDYDKEEVTNRFEEKVLEYALGEEYLAQKDEFETLEGI